MSAICLRHVEYQSLGAFEEPLRRAGFDIAYVDVGHDSIRLEEVMSATVVVILGGPFDVDDRSNLALQDEISAIRRRLEQDRPTIGVCLGSQVIATALGGTVGRMPCVEIGWRPIRLTAEGRDGPLRHLEGLDVLHWHACESSVPAGALRLARTDACSNQAFQVGRNILGLQFHAEVYPDERLEAWVSGHREMLASAGVAGEEVMAQTICAAGVCRDGISRMLRDWLRQIAT